MVPIRSQSAESARPSAFIVSQTLRVLCMLDAEHLPKGLTADLIQTVERDSPETAQILNRAHQVMLEDWEGAREQCRLASANWDRKFADLLGV